MKGVNDKLACNHDVAHKNLPSITRLFPCMILKVIHAGVGCVCVCLWCVCVCVLCVCVCVCGVCVLCVCVRVCVCVLCVCVYVCVCVCVVCVCVCVCVCCVCVHVCVCVVCACMCACVCMFTRVRTSNCVRYFVLRDHYHWCVYLNICLHQNNFLTLFQECHKNQSNCRSVNHQFPCLYFHGIMTF